MDIKKCLERVKAIEDAMKYFETEMNDIAREEGGLHLIGVIRELEVLGWTELTP